MAPVAVAELVGPVLELLGVGVGNTDHLGDDLYGQGPCQDIDEVDGAGPEKRLYQGLGQVTDAPCPSRLDVAWREGLRGETTQAFVRGRVLCEECRCPDGFGPTPLADE